MKKQEFIEKTFNVKVDDLFIIAKSSILYFLEKEKWPRLNLTSKNGASFVTLFENSNLRGCIGSIKAIRPLVQDVSINAINAAFFDPRFLPLTKEELDKFKDYIEIEISILTPLKKFKGSLKEWIEFISKEKPGVYIQKGIRSATFLPDVWEDLKDPFEFMNHLALKAGMNVTEWVDADKYYYFTYSFKKNWQDIKEDFSIFK